MKRLFLFLIAVGAIAAIGWPLSRHFTHTTSPPPAAPAERRILYYQSPMHPWVKSPSPGKCTVCGMDLVPVYDAASGDGAMETSAVVLPAGSPHVAGVQTTEVRRGPLRRTLRVAGTIDDDDTRHRFLSATADGRIDRLGVPFEGAEVVKGQPLARFFSRPILGAVAEYRVAMQQAGHLKEPALNRLRQFGLTLEQISQLPGQQDTDFGIDLESPMTGTVVKRHVYEGQYVKEGDPLFEIADFSTMWFQFIAYERDLPFLHQGQHATVTTASVPGRSFDATVRFINPNFDETTRTTKVRVEIPNADRALKHRLYGNAEIELDAPEVLVIPRTAVLRPGRQPRVYVENAAGVYDARAIALGAMGDELCEVVNGLTEGERVVTHGNFLIDSQAQLNGLAMPGPTASVETTQPVAQTSAAQTAEPAEAASVAQTAATTQSPAASGEKCPVSGELLGSMGQPLVLSYQGEEVKLCCKSCKPEFEKEPAKYLAKLHRP